MSDPRDRADELNPQPLPPEPPERRKGISPLIWILLLLALLALGWWFYNRSVQTGVDTTAPVATEPVITSQQEVAAEAERERAATNDRRRAERADASRSTAPRAPANREVAAVERVQPTYPPAAFRAGDEGTVLVRVEVDASGNPTGVDVARRSGSRELDRAALEAVRKWRFDPAIKDGKAVASTAEVPVEFKLAAQ